MRFNAQFDTVFHLKSFERESYDKDKRDIKQLSGKGVTSLVCTDKLPVKERSYRGAFRGGQCGTLHLMDHREVKTPTQRLQDGYLSELSGTVSMDLIGAGELPTIQQQTSVIQQHL